MGELCQQQGIDGISLRQAIHRLGKVTYLPRIQGEDVDQLLSQRSSRTSSDSLAWVAELLKDRAIGLGTQITSRSFQFSADILAASGNGRSYKRVRIVVDTRSTPQIIYRRDLTDRGWPMDPQILAALRTGQLVSNNRFGTGNLQAGTLQ